MPLPVLPAEPPAPSVEAASPSTPSAGAVGGSPWRRRVLCAAVVGAVAIAFADSSIVVLALPELYGTFDTTVVGVSMVVTVYNVAIGAVALALVPAVRRVRPWHLVGVGFAVFAAASLLCGAAGTLPVLLVGRAVQGAGAAAALTGALALLGRVLGSPERGRRVWALAATVGTALGPVLGGVLTELASWRAIFLVQAPVAALALVALADRGVRAEGPEPARPVGARALWANAAYVFLYGALVGALFLAVLLVVVVWQYSPAEGALIVSALPLATVAVGPWGRPLPAAWCATGGPLLLAGGLAGLAFLPTAGPGWALPALACCGVGLGLASAALGPAATPAGSPPLRAGAATVGARHAGFVLGLVLVAPLLSGAMDHGIHQAALGATATVLDAPVGLDQKVPLALDLGTTVLDTPKGEVPDLAAPFERADTGDADVTALQRELVDGVAATLTRAFRSSFVLAALLGAVAVVPAVGAVAVSRRRWRVVPAAVGLSLLLPVALVGAEWRSGAGGALGERATVDPCTADAQPFPESGFDAWLQRIALSGLNGAACELGVSREEMVLSTAAGSGFEDRVRWDSQTTDDAVRAGLQRAIDDGEERGGLPGWAAAALGFAVDRAPVGWLLDRLDLPFQE